MAGWPTVATKGSEAQGRTATAHRRVETLLAPAGKSSKPLSGPALALRGIGGNILPYGRTTTVIEDACQKVS